MLLWTLKYGIPAILLGVYLTVLISSWMGTIDSSVADSALLTAVGTTAAIWVGLFAIKTLNFLGRKALQFISEHLSPTNIQRLLRTRRNRLIAAFGAVWFILGTLVTILAEKWGDWYIHQLLAFYILPVIAFASIIHLRRWVNSKPQEAESEE